MRGCVSSNCAYSYQFFVQNLTFLVRWVPVKYLDVHFSKCFYQLKFMPHGANDVPWVQHGETKFTEFQRQEGKIQIHKFENSQIDAKTYFFLRKFTWHWYLPIFNEIGYFVQKLRHYWFFYLNPEQHYLGITYVGIQSHREHRSGCFCEIAQGKNTTYFSLVLVILSLSLLFP
jgi:hypothetical protein